MSLVWQTKRILNLICQYCQAKYTRTKGTHTHTHRQIDRQTHSDKYTQLQRECDIITSRHECCSMSSVQLNYKRIMYPKERERDREAKISNTLAPYKFNFIRVTMYAEQISLAYDI